VAVVRRCVFLLVLSFCASSFAAQTVVSFGSLFSGPGQFINDSSVSLEAATFLNSSYESWGYFFWAGFSFSTVSNTIANSFTNQYAAAQSLPRAYAVGYHDYYQQIAPEITFDLPAAPKSILVNNTTYTALTIQNGDEYGFSQPFGTGDTFIMTLIARDIEGTNVATTNHYLADFRDGKTFIQTNWTQLDLSWMPPTVVSLSATLTTTDVGALGPNTPTYVALADLTYAYAGVDSGIASTNPALFCWANGIASCTNGPNVSNQFLIVTNALGPAFSGDSQNGSLSVKSLGDNGSITLTFPWLITDGPGPDFAVFENAFSESFLELAYVEVSSDGDHFFRFPTHTLGKDPIDTYARTNATESNAYGNLAGKHLQGFGTPFDLRELAGTPGLDTRRVTHVRIIDILGDGSNQDSYGNPIYDPSPTWGSGGFDLDAIGVLNARIEISTDPTAPLPDIPGYTTIKQYTPTLYPHPTPWTNALPETNTPGFFRYLLVK